jgi:hypothetical protein
VPSGWVADVEYDGTDWVVIDVAGIVAATETSAGGVELATTAEVQSGTDTERVPSVASLRGGLIVSGTQANVSGTSNDRTGIPSWVKKITIMLDQVTLDASTSLLVQIGDSGGIEASGYTSGGSHINDASVASASNSTAGFLIWLNSSSGTRNGAIALTLMNAATNTWVCTHSLHSNVGGTHYVLQGGGTKSLSSTLDRIRLTTVSGTANFNGGAMNIVYE